MTLPDVPVSQSGRLDRVYGNGLTYLCRVGCEDWERRVEQRIVVDFEVETHWRPSTRVDRAVGIVNYDTANAEIARLVTTREYRLIETMAEEIAELLCTRFPVSSARVKVTKLPIYVPNAQSVAVECWRVPADFPGPAGSDGTTPPAAS